MRLVFDLEKMPVTAQRRGITKKKGKLQFYGRQGSNNYELQAKLLQNAPKEPIPAGTPTKLAVVFRYVIKQKKRWWQWKTSRPDLDNLLKNLQDYMTKFGYYADDSQICWLDVRKYHDEKNSIEIELTELEEIKL